jgi:hypothetical protein
MFDEKCPDKTPREHPKSASQRVANQKYPPIHFQGPRNDTIELAQHVEEPCKRHGEGAVSLKYSFDFLQTLGVEADLLAVLQDNRTAKPAAYQVSDVVAQNAADPRKKQQSRKRYLASPSKSECHDQERLTRQRKADRFKRQNQEHGDNAVVADERLQVRDNVAEFTHWCPANLVSRRSKAIALPRKARQRIGASANCSVSWRAVDETGNAAV